MTAELVALSSALADIPDCLRRLADQIEKGHEIAAVVVLDDGDRIDVKGYGQADTMRAAGMMVIALNKLARA